MSRIGKKTITFNKEVQVIKESDKIEVHGPKGILSINFQGDIEINVESGEINVKRNNDQKKNKALHGLYRALIQNMITGVTEGFSKKLELIGIGYRAELKGHSLLLQLGYSHPVVFNPPPEIKLDLPSQNSIVVSGINKQLVGLIAAKIRSLRPPEPYKGKGIKYDYEIIRRKAGKTAAK